MSNLKTQHTRLISILVVCVIVVVGGVAAAMSNLPERLGLRSATTTQENASAADDHPDQPLDPHAGHNHGSGNPEDAIELSPQARENLQLRVKRLSLGSFTEYIEVPGVVTNWPGRTHIVVTAPMTGVINAIHISQGEMIISGTPLFSLRLTHQDLVKTQEEFLTQLGQLDVEDKEIARLKSIANSGIVAGKAVITRQYERDKLMAGVRAARQSMLLHGLTAQQIEGIEQTRELVREITVFAPQLHEDDSLHHDSLHHHQTNDLSTNQDRSGQTHLTAAHVDGAGDAHVDAEWLVTMLDVDRGQAVMAGENLAQLSDYSQLLIEGHAFQRDGSVLREAAKSQASLQAMMEGTGNEVDIIEDLKIVTIGHEVGRQSRTLPFYVQLDNEIERSQSREGHQYVSWLYKPGQRLTLRLPTRVLQDVFVVPKEAVGEQGLEHYVFVDNGDHLDRVAVRIVAEGPRHVAIANNGQLSRSQRIAVNAAHQLLMALRNQAGGGVDPHAGHNH